MYRTKHASRKTLSPRFGFMTTMTEALDKLQHIYAKWEAKGPYSKSGGSNNFSNYKNTLDSGRQAWRNKFKDVGPPPVRKTKQRFRVQPLAPLSSVRSSALGFYKTSPTIFPINERRPYNGRCCSCMPTSRHTLYEEEYEGKGLRDILRVDTAYSTNDWMTRMFSHVVFAMRRNVSHKYPDVSMAVMTSPRLAEAIQKNILQDKEIDDLSQLGEKQLKKCQKMEKKRAVGILKKMRTQISNYLIRFTGWFLHKLLGRLLSSILVHQGQLTVLEKACKKDLPLIFLPTHRSHLDYILLTFILFNIDIRAPHIAAGDNLYIPFFSMLMKGLGGYFIRRRLDSSGGQKDHTYRAVLHTYMEELLKEGEYFEFFIEGGRTRSGKALYPKGGLLSIVVDSYMMGSLPDAYIVPVGISYEKILDGNFNREQMGEAKRKESFWNAWRGILRVMKSTFGSVRVDFAQPFSLKEYLQVSQSFSVQAPRLSLWSHQPPSPGTLTLKSSGSSNSLGYMASEDHRYSIQGLAEHVITGCVSCQSIMSTHILAFLFLTKYREGVTLKKLTSSADWLREEILLRSRDLGFSGKSRDMVLRAADLLGSSLVEVIPEKGQTQSKSSDEDQNNNNPEGDNTVLNPIISLPGVFELAYYSNIVTCVFALDGVLAAAVCSEISPEDLLNAGHDAKVLVSRLTVVEKATDLAHIFMYEYIFKSPCQTWDSVMSDVLDRFLNSDLFLVDEEINVAGNRERDWAMQLSNTLSWAGEDSESEEESPTVPDTIYQVNVHSPSCMEKLHFFREVLSPLLETYYISACELLSLEGGLMLEEDMTKQIHDKLKQRVKDGVAAYAESASMDSVKNSLRSFKQLRVVDNHKKESDGKTYLQLYGGSTERILQLINMLQAFRK